MVFIPPELLKEKDPKQRKKNFHRALIGAFMGLLIWLIIFAIWAL